MFEPLLLVHSWTRWIVLISAIYFFIKSTLGWLKKKTWTAQDNYFIWVFTQMFGYQIGFGLALWLGTSPITKSGFKNPSLISENPIINFYVLRHPLEMVSAFAVYHIGRTLGKRASVKERFKIYSITFGVVLMMVVSAIPWSGLAYGRPLFRWTF